VINIDGGARLAISGNFTVAGSGAIDFKLIFDSCEGRLGVSPCNC
jgi:hypothetical protein